MAYRHDDNHKAIAKAFQDCGWTVTDTSWSRGRLLDMIVERRKDEMYYIEVKNGPKYELTDREKEFIPLHPGRCLIIWSVEQVKKLSGVLQ